MSKVTTRFLFIMWWWYHWVREHQEKTYGEGKLMSLDLHILFKCLWEIQEEILGKKLNI